MITRLLSHLSRLGDWCLYAAAALAAVGLFLMMALVTVDVLLREFARPTGVAVEITGYLLSGITFMGTAYTLRKDRHIRIHVFTDRLAERKRQWLYIVALIVGLGFAIWFFGISESTLLISTI